MHWVDIEKVPEQWREGQHPKHILRYNCLTSAAARAGNLAVFDTYKLTRGGATLDGVHVPAPVSLAKLQLLLGPGRGAPRSSLAGGLVTCAPAAIYLLFCFVIHRPMAMALCMMARLFVSQLPLLEQFSA